MKVFQAVTAVLSCCLCIAPAMADDWTQSAPITSIQISTNVPSAGERVSLYFFRTMGAWGASSCPGASMAYTSSASPGAKELLALAMLAKASQKNVRFLGYCQDATYFVATTAVLDD